ncbi:hypothetical protein [Rhodococcus opacus]|uniref:hypothetical protein n=1 Tax=Rhodococcus opacus TaxID=37919 RepID=UPI001C44E203|nr:hypothetical protein [Rhodococcus opacus]MBV6758397.1 hypothetical protein [Rhodococcus opacus]
MSDDLQKHRVRLTITFERVAEIDVDMQEYAEWLDAGGEGGIETYLDELAHDPDGSSVFPNEWFEGSGEYHSLDVEDASPVAEVAA